MSQEPSPPTPGISRAETIAVSTGVHRHAAPLQRMRGGKQPARSSTEHAPPPLTRRRSSLLSDFSLDEAKTSLRLSTDDLLLPRAGRAEFRAAQALEEEPSNWYSAPLAFGLLPALGGLLFNNGSAFVTDILLLGLAAIFLNWFVRLPWHWYRSAQAIQYTEPRPIPPLSDAIHDEEDDELDSDNQSDGDRQSSANKELPPAENERLSPGAQAASEQLQRHELLALGSCFLGPILGAYLLHTIRGQLSRPSEGLVSNYNLTIFLLVSELRPCSHLFKLIQARTLYLQRIARSHGEPHHPPSSSDLMLARIAALEEHMAATAEDPEAKASQPEWDAVDITNNVRSNIQPQLDALTRAVRRYEKRATTQSMQTEARLQELEMRLRDAVSLAAAAAAQNRQRPGLVASLVNAIVAASTIPIYAARAAVTYPLQMFNGTTFVFGRVSGSPRGGGRGARQKKEAVPGANSHRVMHVTRQSKR